MAKYHCKICGRPLGYTHSFTEGDFINRCGYCERKQSIDEKSLNLIKKALSNNLK